MSRRNDGTTPTEDDTPRGETASPGRRDPPLSPLADESVGATEQVHGTNDSGRHARSGTGTVSGTVSGSGKRPEFLPRPYMFVIDGEEVMPESTSQARTPPYWLLVDHTFAVIYCMCSPRFKDTPSLGISQLTWALELVKTVKSRRGNYHKDIKLLIGALEDRILDCYVAIGAKTDELNELESSVHTSQKQPVERKKRQPAKQSSSPTNRTSSKQDVSEKEEGAKNRSKSEPMSAADEKEFAEFEAGLEDRQQPRQARVNYHDATRHAGKPESKDVAEYYENLKNSDGRVVLSVTYDEVVARAPAVDETPQRAASSRRPPKRILDDGDTDSDGGAANKRAEKKDSRPAASTVSRQNLMAFFASWRQEQVERLQVEMQRLSNIEEFMARIDGNFDRVLDEDVARRLKEVKPDEKKRKPASDSARFANTR